MTQPQLLPAEALSGLPGKLRGELLTAFGEIVKNYTERRWEPAELNGGKLCEVTFAIAKGNLEGTYPARATKPRNMVDACRSLEGLSSANSTRSMRIQVPRMIVALYEVRNNRNVGHVGGEVDPNHMDAVCVLQMSKWMVAELVRVLHNLPIDEASEVVDSLVERETPIVWKVGDQRRVLDTSMSMLDKTLVLLHAASGPVPESDLRSWVEHSNASAYRRDVLRRAHKARLIEYDQANALVYVSPLGIERAERLLSERL